MRASYADTVNSPPLFPERQRLYSARYAAAGSKRVRAGDSVMLIRLRHTELPFTIGFHQMFRRALARRVRFIFADYLCDIIFARERS